MKGNIINILKLSKMKSVFLSLVNNKNKARTALLFFISFICFANSFAQNTNSPNKMGPMNVEVNTRTGNLFLNRSDIYTPARKLDFDISFSYNSFNYTENKGYGKGWIFSYGMQYKIDSLGRVLILWGDGREDTFTNNSNRLLPKAGFFDSLSQYQSGKYLLKSTDGMQFYFDNATHKRLTKMQEPNGNVLKFNYTDSLITGITNSAGQTITLAYSNGNLSSVTDANAPPAQTYNYSYDGYGNLTKVTDPMGGTYKYNYLVNGPLSSITDKNNNVADIVYYPDFSAREMISCNSRTSFSYDTTTRTTTVIDFVPTASNQTSTYKFNEKGWLSSLVGSCCGYNMTFAYDNNGNLISRKDANGNIYNYTYDNKGNYLSIIDPQNNATTYTYSSDFNNITGLTDPLGNAYTVNYDAAGNPTQLNKPGGLNETFTYNVNGDLITSKDENNNITNLFYDAYGYPQKITLPLSTEMITTFDGRGNLLSGKDQNGNSYFYQYDSLNRLKKTTDPLNNSLSFTYDREGNVTSYTDAKGFNSIVSYDASNRIVNMKYANGATEFYGYDAMHNLISYTDELGKTTAFNYDNQNRLATVSDAAGNGFGFSYDAAGNMLSAVNPVGNTMNYIYDGLNRLIGVSDETSSMGNITYDKNGRATSITNGQGASLSMGYDNLNRVTSFTDALGNARVFTYDNNDNLLSIKDRNNHISSYVYNALNRVTSFTDKNNNQITPQYDANGNLLSITDQNGNITMYQYDGLNRLLKIIYPDGGNIIFAYDNNNNIISKKLTDGSNITYGYDSTNKIISKDLPNGEHFTYTYDAKKRLISASNAAGIVSFAYDNINRIVSETFNAHTTVYGYNIPGKTISTTYPNGTVITKSFDNRLRLTGITVNSQLLASYQYNIINQPLQKSYSNGVITYYQYDNSNRLNSITSNKSYLPSLTFQYDNEMNKTVVARTSDPQYSETFAYDNNYRLINYKQGMLSGSTIPSPFIQNSYTYDAVGNRTMANLNGINTIYTNNNLNQYTQISNSARNIIFTYDGNGNQTYDGNFYMRYDANGKKLTDSASSNIYHYVYDALGRRIQKIINSNSVNFYYTGLQQIEERNNADSLLASQVFVNAFMPLIRNTNNQKYFYHQNDMNSTEAITDSTGNLTEHYRYEDFGRPTIYDPQNNSLSTSAINNTRLYTGQEYDYNTSDYQFHYRNYSPLTGSFKQRDPIGYADEMGMYQYVGNNPENFLDFLGLAPCPPQTRLIDQVETSESWVNGLSSWTDIIYKKQLMQQLIQREKQLDFFIELLEKQGRSSEATTLVKDLANTLQQTKDLSAGKAVTKLGSGLGKLGFGLNVLDLGIKSYKLGEAIGNYNTDGGGVGLVQATGNAVQSGLGFTPVGALYNLFDFTQEKLFTGKNMNDLSAESGQLLAQTTYSENYKIEEIEAERHKQQGDYKEWFEAQKSMIRKQRQFQVRKLNERHWQQIQSTSGGNGCPPNDHNDGTQRPNPNPIAALIHFFSELIFNHDPNEMIGPDGVGDNKWVSINDKLPYQILFENDKTATAPVKVVKVIYPIDPKQDVNTFQLGSFGFNSLTFSVPANTNNYYQRLDVRDSLGLYVDITAGIDAVKNQAFWIFESIDPITQQITRDPLKGFLLRQDSAKPTSGNGFVNFSIKPVTNAHTGDTTSAIASIVFDSNDTIPTNRVKNTIDALPPTSVLNSNYQVINANTVKLSWHGNDDAGGSGIANYSLYISTNNKPYTLYRSNINDTSILFSGVKDSAYCFFIAAKDSVKNEEPLRNNCALTVSVSGGPVYVSNLTDYFRSKQSSNWNDVNTWESSPDNVVWNSATLTPNFNSNIITINAGHTVTITADVTTDQTIVNPLGALIVTGSNLIVINNGLTLKSNATGTARIGNSSGNISGNVNIERSIPANSTRAWRLLSIPTVTTQTVNAAWQNGVTAGVIGFAGIGTMITSNNGNASFDFQTPGNSMLNYDSSANSWTGIPSTNSSIATDNGYMLFIRGDRTATPSNSLITATTLNTTGTLKQGNYPASPLAISINKFGLIGNPYASQIDFRNVTKTIGIDNTFYVWDPKLTGSYGLGAYQTLTQNGSNYIITPGGGSYGSSGSVMNTIESGQAFFVHASATGNVSFTENAKSNGSNMVFRTVSTPAKSLITNLYSIEAAGDDLADGTMNLFNNNYSNSIDASDALKLTNFGLNLGLKRDDKILSVEKRNDIKENDTIYFNLNNAKQQLYRFEFIANGLDHTGLSAFLIDKYLNTSSPVDLDGRTLITFGVTSDGLSSAASRFNIVFTKSSLVPANTKSSIVIYPNPIENDFIKMHVNNMPKGNYTVKLFNSLGQQVAAKQINHAGGSSTETLRVNKVQGVYLLEITNPDNTKQTTKIIIN